MYWRKSKQARGSVLKGIARIVITDDATAVVVPHLSIKFLQGCRTSEIDRQMYQNFVETRSTIKNLFLEKYICLT